MLGIQTLIQSRFSGWIFKQHWSVVKIYQDKQEHLASTCHIPATVKSVSHVSSDMLQFILKEPVRLLIFFLILYKRMVEY